MSSLAWYAVRVRSNHERIAADYLRHRGMEEFVPTFRMRKRWSDRVKSVECPLFGGYVFCRFDPREMVPVLSAPGVVNVVGFGNRPAPVPEEELDAVRRVLESGLPASPWPYLKSGDAIRIRSGPLKSLEGRLERVRDEWRVVVSVNLLQRSVAVEVDPEVLEPA